MEERTMKICDVIVKLVKEDGKADGSNPGEYRGLLVFAYPAGVGALHIPDCGFIYYL